MTHGEDMEQEMLKALNGTWRTWETGYPIRFITITDADIIKRQRDRTRKQYKPISKVWKKKRGRPKSIVNNS